MAGLVAFDRDPGRGLDPVLEYSAKKWELVFGKSDAIIESKSMLADSNSGQYALVPAAYAFGFATIHPFDDGNGRIHHYLIHCVLAGRSINPLGMVFQISSAILSRADDYATFWNAYPVACRQLRRPTANEFTSKNTPELPLASQDHFS